MRDFATEARRVPYVLELDDGREVVLADPHTLDEHSILEVAEGEYPLVLTWLLGDDAEIAWSQLRFWSLDEIADLVDDACSHYGCDRERLGEVVPLLEHYPDAIEADLHESGIDVLAFYDGRLPANKLANLVEFAQRRRNSFLTWAMGNDEELYRQLREQQRARGEKPNRSKKRRQQDELFERELAHDQLANIIDLLQHLIHTTAVRGTKAKNKKPKITHWPAPRTAREAVERREAREAAEHVDSILVFAENMPAERRRAVFGEGDS